MISLKTSPLSQSRSDLLLRWGVRAAALLSGVVVIGIAFFLLNESAPIFGRIGFSSFLTDTSWNPTEGRYNLTPMLVGTLYATVGAVLITTPLGLLSAMFCHFYASPRVAQGYRRVLELLSGIPSVVYGFWGLVVLAPLLARIQPPGTSLLAGVLILSIMILPTIALTVDASFANVPKEIRLGAAAMGFSKWGTIWRVIVPSARSGIMTGTLLETGRAIGETMAVLMVCGNVVQNPKSIFEPIRTLTANIALEMAYALGDHRAALFVSGFLLLLMVVALVWAAEVVSKDHVYG